MTARGAEPAPVTAVIDSAGAWLPAGLGDVEARLRAQASAGREGIEADARRTLEAGGKRMRPLLVLICAGPEAGKDAVRAATAVELVHMATLVHDDVLDAAPLRRGQPTVAATSGRRRAVATGDLLFSAALSELVLNGSNEQVGVLTDAARALVRGELEQRADAYDTGVGVERYLHRCRLKTATLFESACVLGALAGGREESAGPLGTFGREVGVAFQLLDDILDVTGPPERTGKARGTDLLDGTVTLPLILAARHDPGLASLDLRSLDPASAEEACDRIAATGALEEVRRRALELIGAAKAALGSASPADEQRALLARVADGVVDRYG